jgi:mRNA interferase MazF
VELTSDDPLVGRVLCDEVMQLWNDEIVDDAGALSRRTMERVADGLRHALGL